MTHPAFTPRNVAKYVAKALVHGTVSSQVQTAMVDRTRFEDDDMIVTITGNVVGWAVSDKLKPVTDKMVDATADRIVAFRERRNQSDDTDTEK